MAHYGATMVGGGGGGGYDDFQGQGDGQYNQLQTIAPGHPNYNTMFPGGEQPIQPPPSSNPAENRALPVYQKRPEMPSAALQAQADPVTGAFVCSQCANVYATAELLETHIKCRHEMPTYCCSTCGQLYTSSHLLRRHCQLRGHDFQAYPFLCDVCGNGYEALSLLETHVQLRHAVDSPKLREMINLENRQDEVLHNVQMQKSAMAGFDMGGPPGMMGPGGMSMGGMPPGMMGGPPGMGSMYGPQPGMMDPMYGQGFAAPPPDMGGPMGDGGQYLPDPNAMQGGAFYGPPMM